jgi:Ca-activated chloride channel family protein
MDRLSEGIDPATVRNEVVPVALRHHLVSQYTSLVAVDQTPSGLSFGACEAEMAPTANGGGNVAGELPQTATPATLLLLAGIALITIALAASRWGLS